MTDNAARHTATDLDALIERVEAASAPDREIDLFIMRWVENIGGDASNAEPYTASIDAAMTLLPGPDWEWSLEVQVGHHVSRESECMIAIAKVGDPMRGWESTAATTALALCAAALRARKDHQ
jgi:uncharacterized protein YmfQ (DUF2313 family)